MRINDARRWLGQYFLVCTAFIGAFILLAADTILLPLEEWRGKDAFQVVVPVLIGQLVIVFKWIGESIHTENRNDGDKTVPTWSIKGPPIASLSIFAAATLVFALGNGKSWSISPDAFIASLTFALSILNASTIFLMTALFSTQSK